MTIIDRSGRLFGRLNIVDLIVVVGLTLLGVATFMTAKDSRPTPVPMVTSVEPGTVGPGKEAHVTVHGVNLRPLTKISFGRYGADLFTANATLASATAPALEPGTYDVVIYDQGEELSRLPKAFTVASVAIPTVDVQVAGTFSALDPVLAKTIVAGAAFPPGEDAAVARVIAVKPPEPGTRRLRVGDAWLFTPVAGRVQVPAVLRLSCTPVGDECLVGDTVVGPGAAIALPAAGSAVAFVIDLVRPADALPEFPLSPAKVRPR